MYDIRKSIRCSIFRSGKDTCSDKMAFNLEGLFAFLYVTTTMTNLRDMNGFHWFFIGVLVTVIMGLAGVVLYCWKNKSFHRRPYMPGARNNNFAIAGPTSAGYGHRQRAQQSFRSSREGTLPRGSRRGQCISESSHMSYIDSGFRQHREGTTSRRADGHRIKP